MNPFTYVCASSPDQAIAQAGDSHEVCYLGGGTNLIDLMKTGVTRPSRLIDITRLDLATIAEHSGGVRIGATAKNSTIAVHPMILDGYPILSEALLAGASPQIRNMATAAGNLMQRTRCYYFYDPTYAECNKRTPGSGCAALQGINRIHAIVGSSDHCVATHPSDMAVALAVLEASINVRGRQGDRQIPISSFYKLPGNSPHIETDLQPGELITSIDLPASNLRKSHYVKIRDRNSFAFALVSVAALIEVDSSGRIAEARFALGGIAPRPWRVPAAEATLRGLRADDPASYRKASEVALRGARPLPHNAFKVELAHRAVARALMTAAERA